MRPVALAGTEDSARVPGRAARPASLDKIPTEMVWGWAQDKTVRMAPVVAARVAVRAATAAQVERFITTTCAAILMILTRVRAGRVRRVAAVRAFPARISPSSIAVQSPEAPDRVATP